MSTKDAKAKEIKLSILPSKFNVKYGTMNRENPQAVYAIITTWVSPKEKLDSYNSTCQSFSLKSKNALIHFFSISSMFDDEKMIVDIDIRKAGIEYGKRKFVDIEVHIKQLKNLDIDDVKFNHAMNDILERALQRIVETTDFTFTSKK